MKVGFDPNKYLEEQSKYILERVNNFDKLYLEFGGKLVGDYHAKRVLPGFDENAKIKLLHSMKDKVEIVICVYAEMCIRDRQGTDWAYIYDARKDYVYEKRLSLELSGAIISPILTKVCFYNYDYRLIDARRDFQRALPAIFGEQFRTLLVDLHALPARKSAQEFDQIVRNLTARHGQAVAPTLEMYQHRWHAY